MWRFNKRLKEEGRKNKEASLISQKLNKNSDTKAEIEYDEELARISNILEEKKEEIFIDEINVYREKQWFNVEATINNINFDLKKQMRIVEYYASKIADLTVVEETKNGFKVKFSIVDKKNLYIDIKNMIIDEKDRNPLNVPIAYDFKGKTHVVNQKKHPHIVVSGPSGGGKSTLVKCILAMMKLLNGDNFEIFDIYGAKQEFSMFHSMSNCIASMHLGDDKELKELDKELKRIFSLAEEREAYFATHGYENIEDYVARNVYYGLEYKPLFITIDEFPLIKSRADDSSYKTKEGNIYNSILQTITDIAQQGRSSGIYLILMVQKATSDSVPTKILNNCSKLSLVQSNSTAAKYAVGEGFEEMVMSLKEREALIVVGGNYKKLTIPFTTNFVIEQALGYKLYEKAIIKIGYNQLIKRYSKDKSKLICDMKKDEIIESLERYKEDNERILADVLEISNLTEIEKEAVKKHFKKSSKESSDSNIKNNSIFGEAKWPI